jgi:hypothetical protein
MKNRRDILDKSDTTQQKDKLILKIRKIRRRRKKFQLHHRPQKFTGMPSAPFSTNDAHRV